MNLVPTLYGLLQKVKLYFNDEIILLQKGLTYEDLKKQLGDENIGVTSVNDVRIVVYFSIGEFRSEQLMQENMTIENYSLYCFIKRN